MAAATLMKKKNEEQAKTAGEGQARAKTGEQQAKKTSEQQARIASAGQTQSKTSEQEAKRIIFAANNSLAELLCREANANCRLSGVLAEYDARMKSKPTRNDTSYG